MSQSGDDQGLFMWAIGGLATAVAGITRFINGKVDRKVSQEVFEEFKHGNAMSHDRTHHQLKEIQHIQYKIFDKLDSKKDKEE